MKGRTPPPRTQAQWSDAELIATASADTQEGMIAVRWAARQYGGDDWLVISTDPPETAQGGRAAWVIELDRLSWTNNETMMLVEVRATTDGYMARAYTGPVWTFALPEEGVR